MTSEPDAACPNRSSLFDVPLQPHLFVTHPPLLSAPTEIDRELAEVNLKYAAERLKTFEFWPKYLHPGKTKLANAGFVYTNKGDRGWCFSCNVVLCAWSPGDDPLLEHYRWSRDCEFLKLCYLPDRGASEAQPRKVQASQA